MTGSVDASLRTLLDEFTLIASRAGAEIMRLRGGGFATRQKPDSSPVTDADEAAETLILEALSRLLPGIPILSEEAAARALPARLGETFALVDPIDGTREFIADRDEFTVNIALVEKGAPRLGVIGAPARGLLWRGIVGEGAERLHLPPGAEPGRATGRTAIHPRQLAAPQIAALSRSHLDPATESFLGRFPGIQRLRCGSSLKFALIAEGAADIYPRLAPTNEWDVAAGHAIVAAAGGAVLTPEGIPFTYGRADRRYVVPSFIAWGNPALAQAAV